MITNEQSAAKTTPAPMVKPKVNRKKYFANELFKGKEEVPSFILRHPMFQKPTPVNKVFPSIGLSNFQEPCKLTKPMLDLKKDNFVFNLIKAMYEALKAGKNILQEEGDKIQFKYVGEQRTAKLKDIDKFFELAYVVKQVMSQFDINTTTYEQLIKTVDGKIALKLSRDVFDKTALNPNGSAKTVFAESESAFKAFTKLRDKFTNLGLAFAQLDQMPEYKTFSTENVTDKNYSVIFSSEGPEGAWDLLTMSMRGLKSCQRWDGEQFPCLIGSILSKYIGIIYITSGSDFERKGSKMIRRAIVRYAVDADNEEPCIIIDRIYPTPQTYSPEEEAKEESLKIFTDALAKRTKLPIYFSPLLGNRVKNMYVPHEKQLKLREGERTYQDTPLKSDLDIKIHKFLHSSGDDIRRNVDMFKFKMVKCMTEHFTKINSNDIKSEEEVYRTIHSLTMNFSISKYCENISGLIFNVSFPSKKTQNPYKKYLIKLLMGVKPTMTNSKAHIINFTNTNVSRSVNFDIFTEFLTNLMISIIKDEIKSVL